MGRVLLPDDLGRWLRDFRIRLERLERSKAIVGGSGTGGILTSLQAGPSGTPISGAVQLAPTPGSEIVLAESGQVINVGSTAWQESALPFRDWPRGLTWQKLGCVVATGTTGAFDEARQDGPTIWFDEIAQRYGMVYAGYSGTPGSPTNPQIGLAWSNDLVVWTKDAASPIFSGSGSGFDAGGASAPLIWYENGMYYLYFQAQSGTGFEGGTASIGLATATSIYGTWTRHGQIIGPAGSGWRSSDVYRASSIVKRGATYYLFFNAAQGAVETIGYATATDPAGPWTVDDVNSPVLNVGAGSAWDSNKAGNPFVIQMSDGNYWMYYYGTPVTWAGRMGVAYTSAANFPLGWTKHAQNPIVDLGPAGSFDESGAFEPYIFVTPGGAYLYYIGMTTRAAGFGHICLAVSPDTSPARGVLAAEKLTTTPPAITVEADVPGLNNAFCEISANRLIKVTAFCAALTGTLTAAYWYITDGANNHLAQADLPSVAPAFAGYNVYAHAEAILVGLAPGKYTFKVRAKNDGTANAVTVNAGATFPAFILVEDCGPVGVQS